MLDITDEQETPEESEYRYQLIEDLWPRVLNDDELEVRGTLTKTADHDLARENLNFTRPIVDNPAIDDYIKLSATDDEEQTVTIITSEEFKKPSFAFPKVKVVGSKSWDQAVTINNTYKLKQGIFLNYERDKNITSLKIYSIIKPYEIAS